MSDGKKLLVVDDELRMCDSLRGLLNTRGYATATCHNGRDALAALEREDFDLVLLDIGMEGMDGFKVMQGMAKLKRSIPVIIMTGNASITSAVEALKLGAYDFLRKPFEPEELFSSIGNALHLAALKQDKQRISKSLEESREQFRTLAENAYDAIMRFDHELRHLYVNPIVERQTGIPRENFIGKTHREIGFPEPLVALWEKTLHTVFTTATAERVEFQLPSGVWIDWLCIPELDGNGNVRAVMSSARDISEHKKTENALRLLSSRLLTSQEEEQHRIAMELHDQTGQDLILLKLNLTNLKNRIAMGNPELEREFDKVLTFTDNIVEDIRRLAYGLSPSQLQALGLGQAMKALIHQFSEKTGLQVQFDLAALDNRFDFEAELILYRIFQEALTNIYKHAAAKTVEVHATQNNDSIAIEIKDDGRGFDFDRYRHASEPRRGMGLSAMELRACMIRADLTISSEPDRGTRIHLRVPCMSPEGITKPSGVLNLRE